MTQEPFTNPYTADDAYEGPLGTRTVTDPSTDYGTTVPETYPGTISETSSAEAADPADSKNVARDEAAELGKSTAEAGRQVAGTAKDQAAEVAGEAKTQAKDLLGQARTEIADQTHTQKKRVAEGLQSISQELRSMSRTDEQGVASDLARQASDAVGNAATWLQDRDPGTLLDDVRSFARRRPAAFLGLALTAGVVAGRLGRGVKDAGTDAPETTRATSTPVSNSHADLPPAETSMDLMGTGTYPVAGADDPASPTAGAYRTGTGTP